MHCTKISAEFDFGGPHPKNLALGYDVGKISAGYLVFFSKFRVNFRARNDQENLLVRPNLTKFGDH